MDAPTEEELQELKADYSSSLAELNTPAVDDIEVLTSIAEENKNVAPKLLAEAIEERIYQAPAKEILPAVYLLDSICKRVRKPYIEIFSQNLITTFTSSYEKITDPKIRISLLKVLKTWAQIFPPELIWKIEQRMRARHRVHKQLLNKVGSRFNTKVYVNPKFFQRPSNVPKKIMGSTSTQQERKPAPTRQKQRPSNNTSQPPPPPPPSMDTVNQQYGMPPSYGAPQPPPSGGPPQQPPPGGPPQQPPPGGHYGGSGMGSWGGPPQQPPPGGPPQQPPPGGYPGAPPTQPPPGGYPGMPQNYQSGGWGGNNGGGPPQQPPPSDVSSILNALAMGDPGTGGQNPMASMEQAKHAQTVHQLYEAFKLKCNICGLRFHIQSNLDDHLDHHIERNQEVKKTLARKWFQEEDDWDSQIEQDPMESPGAIAFSKLSENVERKRKFSEISSPTDAASQNESWKDSVPADPDQEICPICHEPFSKYFDDDEQEWMFGGAKRDSEMSSETYDRIVHTSCLNQLHDASSPISPGGPPHKRMKPNEMFS